MRKAFIFIFLIGSLMSINGGLALADTDRDIPVEVVEVKDLGLSDRDESRTVVEVRWKINPIQQEIIVAFQLTLSVTYADGTTISEKRKIAKDACCSVRIEVPTVKTARGDAQAFIKKMDAKVSAIISKNQ